MTNDTQSIPTTKPATPILSEFFKSMAREGGPGMKRLGAKMLKKLSAANLSPEALGIERHLSKLGLARKVPGEGRSKVWQFGPERAQRGGKRLGVAAAGKVSRAKKSAPGRTRPPTPAAMTQAHRAAKDALRGKRPGYEGA